MPIIWMSAEIDIESTADIHAVSSIIVTDNKGVPWLDPKEWQRITYEVNQRLDAVAGGGNLFGEADNTVRSEVQECAESAAEDFLELLWGGTENSIFVKINGVLIDEEDHVGTDLTMKEALEKLTL